MTGPKRSNHTNNDPLPRGRFQCSSKCNLCKSYFRESKIFRSSSTEHFYNIRHVDCKCKNVIYLVTCNKCKVQYVGSTSNEFQVRFCNHKSAMSTKKTTGEVAVHFNNEKHQLSDFEFILIEQICNIDDKHSVDKRLLTREAFWCSQLCSLQRYGLNKRSEFNSKNRIKYNRHISPFELHFLLLFNRRAFCMRMRQYGLLKGHGGIFCELFTFSTSICKFSGAE